MFHFYEKAVTNKFTSYEFTNNYVIFAKK